VAAEAGGVGQLAGLETSGLRGAAGERNGAVAVAIGWASSGSGHTGGGLVVLLILAVILLIVILVVVILVVAVLIIVRVVLVGAAVLEVAVILVTTGGGRSGSRRGSLQLRCVSTEAALRHERNQIHTTVTVAVTVTVSGLQLSPLPELPEPDVGEETAIRVAVVVEVEEIVVTSAEEDYDTGSQSIGGNMTRVVE
jgi:hypothetical protein